MGPRADTSSFYDAVPRVAVFGDLADPARYVPLPPDWSIGVADIVGSTRTIAEGGYKTVNMVGAAVISAQINAGGGRAFPYIFGGDGAGFACAPDRAPAAAEALTAVQSWAHAEFGLELRVAQVPLSAIRGAGRDVAVARFQATRGVDYAMFSGGGLSWAEAQMKAGNFALPPAAPGAVPDLSGLSCRWSHVRAKNGIILSVVIQSAGPASGHAFSQVMRSVTGIAQQLDRDGHPVPETGPGTRWPPAGATLEAHASHGDRPLASRRRQILAETFLAWLLLRTNIKIAGFDPGHFARTVGRNADFRKFDDGLKMTLDCDPATEARLRAVLERAAADGIIRYGLFRQDEAMMTCIVPSLMRDDHVHFIDGAAGGYTRAAAQIKSG